MATTQVIKTAAPTIPRVSFLNNKKYQGWLAGFGFFAPALIILGLFVVIPMVLALVVSLTDWSGLTTLNNAHFIGLQNYQDLLTNDSPIRDNFFLAVKNTAYYAIGLVPTQTILALLLALVVNQKFLRFKGFFRTAFYFPSITSSVAVSMIFLWLFNRDGIINFFIGGIAHLFGGTYTGVTWTDDLHGIFQNFLGLFGITLRTAPAFLTQTHLFGQTLWQWISGPSVSMFAIMILTLWTTAGTLMLIFLAALQDIPTPLYEAAAVDGATRWQIFRKITVPLLRPTTFFVVTIGIIGTLQVFDQVYVISNGSGNPAGTTLTVSLNVYRSAFTDGKAGLGGATAFLLFVIIMIFTLVQRALTGRNTQ